MKVMKMFAAMVCAAMVLAFTGCSKENDNGGGDLVGSWLMLEITVTETIQGQPHSETETPEEGERTVFNFKKDNTFSTDIVYGEHEFIKTGTYSAKNGQLTIKYDEDEEVAEGSYQIEGDDLTLIITVDENGAIVTTKTILKRI